MQSRDNSKPSICLVAHYAYGALSGGKKGFIGGVEWQTSLMARWFAARGYPVSMLTWDEGQPDGVEIDNVRVFKICPFKKGLPGLRFLHPRWTGLIRAMGRANADLYYQNCAEYVTGQVALWSRRHGRKFVFSSANDPEVDPSLPDLPKLRERVLYRYGLRNADRIIVQTRTQQQKLKAGFGYDSVVLPMPAIGPNEEDYKAPPFPGEGSRPILWIGRICEQKRPDRLLEVARACPDLKFDLVGPPNDTAYAREVCSQAEQLANINVHGPVTRERVPDFYKSAACMCSTSAFEGFPNTFIEAWSYGLPVVSLFDPDHLIAERGLGVAADDVPELVAGFRGILASAERYRQVSDSARRYYLETHTIEAVMPRFEKVFLEALNVVTH